MADTTAATVPESGAGLALLEERLARPMRGASPVTFDPMILISIIMSLIQGCFAPTPASIQRRLFVRAQIAAEVRRRDRTVGWAASYRVADHALDLARDATDAELQSVINDCRD